MDIKLKKTLTKLLNKKDTKKSFNYPLLEDAFSSKDLLEYNWFAAAAAFIRT